MRTCVRVDPARRRRRLLRLRRAARRPRAPRPAADRGRGRGDGGQLRGAGARRPRRHARRAGAAALPGRGDRPGPLRGVRRRRAARCSRCSTARRRSSRGSRSRRRSSTSAASSGSPGTPRAIAARLRSDVREEVGLAVTVGVARTRLLAKMASRAAKPDGLLELAQADETAFLHPLAVEALWGVGEKSARKLHARGIRTVADAAARSETDLIAHPGPRGRRLPPRRRAPPRGPGGAAAAAPAQLRRAARARPRAARRRRARRRPARARRPGHAADARRRADRQDADAARPLRRLHARVARADAAGAHRRPRRRDRRRARAAGRRGPLVARRGCTLLGLSVGNLAEAPAQLALPLDGGPPATDAAIDAVRDRFGDAKLTRATLLNRGPELIPPDAPRGGRPRRVSETVARG